MDEAPTKLSLSPQQAAQAIGLGRTRVFELIREGKLVARKCGRRTLITVADLQACLDALPRVRASQEIAK